MNNSNKEYADTVKELQQVAKSYGIKFTGLKKSALKARLTRVGVCYNPETNNTVNCKSSSRMSVRKSSRKSSPSRKSSRKSVRKSVRKSSPSAKSSRKSVRKSSRKSVGKSPRKLTEYNKFVKKHAKGGKMNLKEVADLWKEHKSRKSRR